MSLTAQERSRPQKGTLTAASTVVVELPYPPSVNRAWRQGGGKMYQPKEVENYKLQAAWTAKAAGARVLTGDVCVTATLHPKATKKGEASKVRLDLDNICKIVLDSFNGVCYTDDRQITRIVLQVGDPKPNGGVTVVIDGR